MGKPTICIGENKDADQLRGDRAADQRLCFRYTSSTFLIQNFQPLTVFCDCTARFVSDLVGTQLVGFLMHRLIYYVEMSDLAVITVDNHSVSIAKTHRDLHGVTCLKKIFHSGLQHVCTTTVRT